MSTRDDILAGLRASEDASVGDLTPEALLDAYRAEVLNEAIAAARSLLLTHKIETDGDVAYNQAIYDVITVVKTFPEGGAS